MRSEQPARLQQGATLSGSAQQFIAGRELSAVMRRDFHQPACHIDGVAGCRDVKMAFAAEPGRDDHAEMRADLEAKSGGDRNRQ